MSPRDVYYEDNVTQQRGGGGRQAYPPWRQVTGKEDPAHIPGYS